jgi:hypothetical protein
VEVGLSPILYVSLCKQRSISSIIAKEFYRISNILNGTEMSKLQSNTAKLDLQRKIINTKRETGFIVQGFSK